MKNWFVTGGSLFMSVLSILFIVILAISVYYMLQILSGKSVDKSNFSHRLNYIKSLGLFTMICGIFGQLVGLFAAFEAIEAAKDLSPSIMAGGLKVSLITTLTGIFIYLVSILIWFLLDLLHQKKQTGMDSQ